LLADLLGAPTARRLYGPISAGGTIGAVGGPLLTKLLLDDIGVAGVLVMTALFLELAAFGAWHVGRIGATLERDRADDPPLPGTSVDGLIHVAASPYLAAIGGFVICTATAATFVYLAQADIVKAALPKLEERTDFFATIDLWTQGATFIIQVLLAGPLLRWLGPGLVLCILPLVQGVGIVALVATPTLAVLVAVQMVARTSTHGLTRPARELLFTVVSREDKYRAKNVIDTLVYRLGDFASAWLYIALVAAGAGGLAVGGATIALAVLWLALAIFLGVGFRRRLSATKESS
jgi:AAA family ATP:ADP antiporter